jgi:hypothetical protein
MKTRAIIVSAALLTGALATNAHARGQVGEKAPWFQLERLTGGSVSSAALRGKPAVLVIGRTQEAAPPCKEWAIAAINRHGARASVHQVIVVEKPWFIPKTLVYGKVKGFVPDHLHGRVLLEWFTVFADAYGIPKNDEPTVLVLDRDSTIRWRHAGKLTPAALARLGSELAAAASGAATRTAAR